MSAAVEVRSQGSRGKFTRQSAITRRLLDGFFGAVGNAVSALPARSAIEIGCGTGHSTARLRALLPRDCALRASDVQQCLVDDAREMNPGIPIEQESIYELPHADQSFDLVVSLEVLEHLAEPDKALAELCRISRKYVLVSVPREPIWRALNFVRGKYLTALGNTPGHLNHWSAGAFASFVGTRAKVIDRWTPLPWTVVLGEVRS